MDFFTNETYQVNGTIEGAKREWEDETHYLILTLGLPTELLSDAVLDRLQDIMGGDWVFIGKLAPTVELFDMNESVFLRLESTAPKQMNLFGDQPATAVIDTGKSIAQMRPKIDVRYVKEGKEQVQRACLLVDVSIKEPTRKQVLIFGYLGAAVSVTMSREPVGMEDVNHKEHEDTVGANLSVRPQEEPDDTTTTMSMTYRKPDGEIVESGPITIKQLEEASDRIAQGARKKRPKLKPIPGTEARA